MIKLLQDTKMSVAGITFTIPKSFCICMEEICDVKDNGLGFTPKENDCCIEVFTVESDMTFNVRDDFISTICDEDTYTVHGEIEERIENYMYSIRAEFESSKQAYFEMHIGQRKGYGERVELLITAKKSKADIREIMKREDVKRFIDSFEVEE